MLPLKFILWSILKFNFLVCSAATTSEEIYQLRLADGTILIESTIVQITDGQIYFHLMEFQKNLNLEADHSAVYEKEWISQVELEKIFNLKFIIDSKKQTIDIQKLFETKNLPALEHIKKYENENKKNYTDDNLKWDHFLTTPNIDFQFGSLISKNDQPINSLNLDLNNQFLFHDTEVHLSTQEEYKNKYNSEIQIILGRQKINNPDLLGFLKASEYKFGSIQNFYSENIINQMPMTGFYITNQLNISDFLLFQKNITGQTRPYWNVYVYVNDILVAITKSDAAGRFVIAEIPLFEGLNTVRFDYSSILGQGYSEEKFFEFDQSFKTDQKFQYQVSIGKNINYGMISEFSFITPIEKWISNLISVHHLENDYGIYFQDKIKLRFNRLSSDFYLNYSAKSDAYVYGSVQKITFKNWNLKLDYSKFSLNYNSPNHNLNLDNLTQESSLESQFPLFLKDSSFFLKLEKKDFIELESDLILSSRIFKKLDFGYFFYELNTNYKSDFQKLQQQSHHFELGILNLNNKNQFNGYIDHANKGRISYLKEDQINEKLSLGGTMGLDTVKELSFIQAQIGYQLLNFLTTYSFRQSLQNDWLFKFVLQMGTYLSESSNKIVYQSNLRKNYGQVKMVLFIDSNNNSLFESDEIVLENAKVKNKLTNEIYISNEFGEINFEQIEPYRNYTYEILIESISNIYLFPISELVQFSIPFSSKKTVFVPFKIINENK